MERFTGHLHVSRQFDTAMLATTLAGAAGWPAWALAARVAPAADLAGGLMLCTVVLAGIGIAWRERWVWLRGVASGTCGWAALVLWGPRYPAVALLAAGACLSAAVPLPMTLRGRINAALALGVAVFVGMFVAGAVSGNRELMRLLPPVVHMVLTGAVFGFLASFGHLSYAMRWRRDHVESAFREQKKRGSVPPLAVQALHVYRRIETAIPRNGDTVLWRETRSTVSRLVLQVLGLARQSAEMGEDLALTDRDELERKRQAMEDAAAGAVDVEAKRHYADTAAILAQRLDRLRQFSQRRERIEALSHHSLSVLENLRLALAQARLSGDAAGPEDVARALERLGALQSELDCTAEALRELDPTTRQTERTGPPPVHTVSATATHSAG